MLITEGFMRQYKKKHDGSLPPIPLHIIVGAIVDFMNVSIDLYGKFPREIRLCISTIEKNCCACIKGEPKDYSIITHMDNLNDIAEKERNIFLKDFYNNHFRIKQIGSGNLNNIELWPFIPLEKHGREAQQILLDFLEITLEKFNQLDDELLATDSETNTERLSVATSSSEGRKLSSESVEAVVVGSLSSCYATSFAEQSHEHDKKKMPGCEY